MSLLIKYQLVREVMIPLAAIVTASLVIAAVLGWRGLLSPSQFVQGLGLLAAQMVLLGIVSYVWWVTVGRYEDEI